MSVLNQHAVALLLQSDMNRDKFTKALLDLEPPPQLLTIGDEQANSLYQRTLREIWCSLMGWTRCARPAARRPSSGWRISSISPPMPLKDLHQLLFLEVDNSLLADLTPLTDLHQLEYLSVSTYAVDGDSAALLSALRIIVRVKGVSSMPEGIGMTRQGLQKALSAKGNPRLDNVNAITRAMDYQLIPHRLERPVENVAA